MRHENSWVNVWQLAMVNLTTLKVLWLIFFFSICNILKVLSSSPSLGRFKKTKKYLACIYTAIHFCACVCELVLQKQFLLYNMYAWMVLHVDSLHPSTFCLSHLNTLYMQLCLWLLHLRFIIYAVLFVLFQYAFAVSIHTK